MRMIFSLIGLLVVLAIVGILAKNQLSSVTKLPNTAPSSANTTTTQTPTTPANIAEQSKQLQSQVKDQLTEAMKAAAEAREKALSNDNNYKPADITDSAY